MGRNRGSLPDELHLGGGCVGETPRRLMAGFRMLNWSRARLPWAIGSWRRDQELQIRRRRPGTDHVCSHVMTSLLLSYFGLFDCYTPRKVPRKSFKPVTDLYSEEGRGGGYSCKAPDRDGKQILCTKGAEKILAGEGASRCPSLIRPSSAVVARSHRHLGQPRIDHQRANPAAPVAPITITAP